ncbi:SURP and G-patch domain-containing protein 1, partial [Ophiophagus hannah]
MPKSVKTNVNILHQEKLIAQKKREIEAKMERQAKRNHLPTQQASQGSDDDSGDGESGVSNKFANDGSFLQQFLKLQKEKQGASSSSSETSHPPPASSVKKPTLTGKRPNLSVSSMLNQVKNYTHSKQTPVTNRLSVFQSPDDEEEEDYEQWLEIKTPCTDSLLKVCPPEDIRTRRIVEKLARVVAEGGPEMEKVALEDCKDNPVFAFLHDKNSPEFLYYRKKLAEMWKKGQDVEETPPSQKEEFRYVQHLYLAVPGRFLTTVKKMEIRPEINLVTVGCVSWGHRTDSLLKVSPPEDEETKDCAEKLARFVADGGPVVEMVALKNHRENQSFSPGPQGTWLREGEASWIGGCDRAVRCAEKAAEGTAREWAEQLTQMGRGKHFIGDFLPPDELEKFMETFKALKNVFYLMVVRVHPKEHGRKPGKGAKKDNQKGVTAVDGAGFGIDRPADLSKDDDEYEAFRKRMMLAYRFRPNPLNNPRRPYY